LGKGLKIILIMLTESLEKQIEKKWEKLIANQKDGYYDKEGFKHSKSYLERLDFVKKMIDKYSYVGELEQATPNFMDSDTPPMKED